MPDTEATGIIRIIKTPDGEAPEHIREAWIGCELPCMPVAGYYSITGILTKTSKKAQYGFCVPQDDALQVLARSGATLAFEWWQRYDHPRANKYFIFLFEEAEILGGVTIQPIIRVDDDMQGDPFR